MNKVKILFVVILSFLALLSYSQTLEVVEWGTFKEIEKNTSFQKIVGHDEDGFYAVSSEGKGEINRKQLWLEYYSNLTFTLEAKNEIILPSVGGIATEFEEMFYLKNKLILFTTATNEQTERKYLYVQYLEQNGQLKNKPKKIGEIPTGNNKEDGFIFVLAENRSKIFISYHNSFMQYNEEPFTFKVMDTSLKIEFDEKFILPLKDRKFSVVKTDIGESGNFYILAKAVQVESRKGRGKKAKKYDNIMLVYNMEKEEFKTYDIKMQKYIPTNVLFTLNEKEEVVICGFFSAKTQKVAGQFLGAFYKIIDPRIEKFLPVPEKKFDFIVFDKTFLAENAQERNGVVPEDYNNYILKDLLMLSNGGFVLLAENYFITEKTFLDPKAKEEILLTYHNYNDIIAVGVNKKGKMDWAQRIPKNQNSLDDNGYYSSYATTIELTKLKIIFNDHKANAKKDKLPEKTKQIKFMLAKSPKAIPFVVTIYTDGSFEKDMIFPGKDAKNVFVPRLFYNTGENYFIYGQKGKTYKFGSFVFE